MIKVTYQVHGNPVVDSIVFSSRVEADLFLEKNRELFYMVKVLEVFH